MYFIPLLAIILVGILTRWSMENRAGDNVCRTRGDGRGDFFSGASEISEGWVVGTFGSGYHYMGAVFMGLIILQLRARRRGYETVRTLRSTGCQSGRSDPMEPRL